MASRQSAVICGGGPTERDPLVDVNHQDAIHREAAASHARSSGT
jgi:hypothetical protein